MNYDDGDDVVVAVYMKTINKPKLICIYIYTCTAERNKARQGKTRQDRAEPQRNAPHR